MINYDLATFGWFKHRYTILANLIHINGVPRRLNLLRLMVDKGGDAHIDTGTSEILEKIKKCKVEEAVP